MPMEIPKPKSDAAYMSRQVRDARRFFRPQAARLTAGVHLVSGGREDCDPHYVVERASFPFWAVGFVLLGRGQLQVKNRRIELGPGSVFVYDRTQPHRIACDPQAPLVKYFFHLTGREAKTMLKRCGLPAGSAVRVAAPHRLADLLENIITQGLHESPLSGRVSLLLLEAALLICAEDRLPDPSGQPGQSGQGRTHDRQAAFFRCRDYLMAHYLQVRLTGDAAKACGYSLAHLCRLFKEYNAGETPHDFLLRLKIRHAATLLQDPDILVKQAAAAVGYHDTSNFIRAYRRVIGHAPGAGR